MDRRDERRELLTLEVTDRDGTSPSGAGALGRKPALSSAGGS